MEKRDPFEGLIGFRVFVFSVYSLGTGLKKLLLQGIRFSASEI